jgi:transcriptional regulator with XRE-family HTH domain
MIRRQLLSHPRDHFRPRDKRPTNGTYRDRVAASSEVNRVRFARFVARALADARERGMTDDDIERATGVGSSTFHRWQRGQIGRAPSIDRVRAFCRGLGIRPRDALLALGVEEGRDDPAPEPVLSSDVRLILRGLADPHISDADKAVIRGTLAMLAARVKTLSRKPAQ